MNTTSYHSLTKLLVSLVLAACAATANAATYNVTTNADSGAGSLREAVSDANSNPGADMITFGAGIGTIVLTSGQIEVADELTITGSATAGQTISGNDASRILAVPGDDTPLALENLTLTNGRTTTDKDTDNPCTITDGSGGALCSQSSLSLSAVTVQNSETAGDGADGGGVFASDKFGDFNIVDSRFVNNSLQSSTASGSAMRLYGGTSIDNVIFTGNTGGNDHAVAITITKDTTISNSTFSNNQPAALNVSDYSGYDPVLSVINSTFSGNYCKSANYIAPLGECSNGVAFRASVDTNLINSTVTQNIVPKERSFSWAAVNTLPLQGVVTLQSSIVAGNLTASGHFSNFNAPSYVNQVNASNSIFGDDASEIAGTNSNNVFTNDPQLGPLADNGCAVEAGAPSNSACVQTHRPLPGSPALDAGANPEGLTTDQRGTGYGRVVNGQADIGALEAPVASALVVTPASVDFGTVSPTNTEGPEAVTLTNPGTANLTVSAIDAATGDFTLSGSSCGVIPFTITAGSGCTIYYTYTPAAVGADNQTINITSDATSSNPDDSFTLQGLGAAAPELRINPASIDFGSTATGSTAGPMTVVLTNPGTDGLTISAISGATGGFALSGGTCGSSPITITPLNNCTLTYTFTPTVAGSATEAISVTSDGVNDSATGFTLQGEGTATGGGNGGSNGGDGDSGGETTGGEQVTPLPAVSTWSFMLLLSLLGGFGMYHSRRRG
jgi:hypothetical protein